MLVFGVKYRLGLIAPEWKPQLYSVMGRALTDKGVKPLLINGPQDHVHVLVSMGVNASVADMVKHLKAESTKWINANRLTRGRFGWQDGYGAFSYSLGQLDQVMKYIRNQEEHHRRYTFREEYEAWLRETGAEITPFSLPELPN